MAELKRNMIELVTGVENDKVQTQKYWTPIFIPMDVTYEALDLGEELEKGEEKERDMLDKLMSFVADKIFAGQFTKDDLKSGLHGPEAIESLQSQIIFIAQGQQSESTRSFLAKKA